MAAAFGHGIPGPPAYSQGPSDPPGLACYVTGPDAPAAVEEWMRHAFGG